MSDILNKIKSRCVEDGDCWVWQGALAGNGTPKMHVATEKGAKKQDSVRRVVAKALDKNIDGKVVTSACGNRRCVCPDHVLVATKRQLGVLNAERTGYAQNPVRCEKIAMHARQTRAKLTPEMVAEIRSMPSARLAAETMGINKTVATEIRSFKRWKEYRGNPWAGLGAR